MESGRCACYDGIVTSPPAQPDIFTYLDHRAYLRDWFEARKAVDPTMSHRAFVRAAGMKSPSVLTNVMSGQRNLSAESQEAFADALALDAEERTFFRALVSLNQATTDEERNDALTTISAERRFRSARHLEGEAFRFLSCWYLPALHQLAALPGFQEDPTWIADQLHPPITVAQATEAMATLWALGLLERQADGQVRPADRSVVTAREIQHLAACNYHRQMTQRAYDSVAGVDASDRYLLGVTIAVPHHLLPSFKQELGRVQARILDMADSAAAPADRVYQVNLQLVPLSIPRDETP